MPAQPKIGAGPVHMDRDPRARLPYIFVEVARFPSGALGSVIHRKRTREEAQKAADMINRRNHHDQPDPVADLIAAGEFGRDLIGALGQPPVVPPAEDRCVHCERPGGWHKGTLVCQAVECPSYLTTIRLPRAGEEVTS
jgi:hypothetical protein